ncbi:MAG: DoxX family protein [Bacteroidota bacterium]
MSVLQPFGIDYRDFHHDIAALLLRLAFGGLMALSHGWDKAQLLFGAEPINFPDPIGLGATAALSLSVFIELGCALLILIGLGTRLATLPLIFAMLVAAFVIHGYDPLPQKELALVYLFAYLAIFFLGPGRYSVDSVLQNR